MRSKRGGIRRLGACFGELTRHPLHLGADGRIAALDFVLLENDKDFFSPYYAAPVVRADLLEESPEVEEILNQMSGLLDNTQMAELNHRVDEGGEAYRDIARGFLEEQGLIGASD